MHRIGVRTAVAFGAALVFTSSAGAHSSYRVRWGDTLTGIAAGNGTSVSALAGANRLDPSRLLLEGTVLRLPGGGSDSGGGGSYVVRPGETLSGIAARFGTSVSVLASVNGLGTPNLVLAGASIRIPGAGTTFGAPGAIAAGWSVRGAIDAWSRHYGVDPRLVRALAWMESGYQSGVVSSAGAMGAMQVTPSAWDYVETVLLGRSVPRTADGNVQVGVAYLAHLLAAFGGDERLALAAYYQGERAVRTIGVLPESELYVEDVLALKSRV